MFGLFKKKSKIDVLREKYNTLIEETYQLSHTDRKASSMKAAEAEAVLKEIKQLEQQNKTD